MSRHYEEFPGRCQVVHILRTPDYIAAQRLTQVLSISSRPVSQIIWPLNQKEDESYITGPGSPGWFCTTASLLGVPHWQPQGAVLKQSMGTQAWQAQRLMSLLGMSICDRYRLIKEFSTGFQLMRSAQSIYPFRFRVTFGQDPGVQRCNPPSCHTVPRGTWQLNAHFVPSSTPEEMRGKEFVGNQCVTYAVNLHIGWLRMLHIDANVVGPMRITQPGPRSLPNTIDLGAWLNTCVDAFLIEVKRPKSHNSRQR